METSLTFAMLLKQAIDNRLLDVHTALIGRIEKYDAHTQHADIQPMLKRVISANDGRMIQEDLPLLVDIPVLFPRAGHFFISLPIQSGDYVQVIFNETSIDDFLTESAPTFVSNQRFTLQGAVAIPGIFPLSKALQSTHKSNLVMGLDAGVQIHIDAENIRLGSEKADEALAIASKVKEELDRIKSAFNSHTHTGSMAAIKPTDRILASTDIATKKVVAE
jgi:hypothetical protein